MKDLKESLSGSRKPDITHVRRPLMVYIARGCEYGDKTQGGKYIRSNFLRPASEHPIGSDEALRAEFKRHRSYMRAVLSHVMGALDSMERHTAVDPDLLDIEGMKRAAFAQDDDAQPGCPVGASRLPEVCGLAASINMAVTQAVTYGLLPADPGQPWRGNENLATVDISTMRVVSVEAVPDRVASWQAVTLHNIKGTSKAVVDEILNHLACASEPVSWVALCSVLPFKHDDIREALKALFDAGLVVHDKAGYSRPVVR